MSKRKIFRSMILSLCVCALCICALLRAIDLVAEGQIQMAPINPEFVKYQEKVHSGEYLAPHGVEEHVLGFIPGPMDMSHTKGLIILSDFAALSLPPSTYDLRSLGLVTPVKDQGSCGSCWAFATYGSLESWLRGIGETWDFSENNLKCCHFFDWGHCAGGNYHISTAYLARWSGPISEVDDPYSIVSGTCTSGLTVRKHVETVLMIPDRIDSMDNLNIKQTVMNHGAVSTSMYYTNFSYNPSDYTYYYKGTASSNHAVAIVGWDDTMPVSVGAPNQPPPGAWIVKNSWGPSWGDGGYFFVSYYDTKIGKNNAAFIDAVNPSSTMYQYDPFGLVGSAGYGSDTAWGANIFTVTTTDVLTTVCFYAVMADTEWEIKVYDNFSGGVFTNQMGATEAGTFTSPGYYSVHLSSPITLGGIGDDFGVVVKLRTPGHIYPIPIEYLYPGYTSGAGSNPGESYMSNDGTNFYDITTYGGSFSTANVCIKAIAIAYDECSSQAECDDTLFCNGTETCAGGICQDGSDPCLGQQCDEINDVCVDCFEDAECDDTLFCNGIETCAGGFCQPGSDPCPGQQCDEINDKCISCNNNTVCEPGEDCYTCPNDCFEGSGAVCGNDVCETANGEDCQICPDDCNGKLNGMPSGRYCCGDGSGEYGITCADPRCAKGGNTCTTQPAVSSCCGDGICEGDEILYDCMVDCGCEGPNDCDDSNECTLDNCVDGICQNTLLPDNTPCSTGICCGGNCSTPACIHDAECADTETCTTDTCIDGGTCNAYCENTWPACDLEADECCGPECSPETDGDCTTSCLPAGASCSDDSDCCSGKCRGRSTRKICRE